MKEFNINNNYNILNDNKEYKEYNININKNENNLNNGYNNNNDYYNNIYNNINNNKNLNKENEIEPDSKFDLTEFYIIGQVGKGTEGIIYSVNWKKNNKKYALKKGEISRLDLVQKRQEEIMMLKNFRKKTGSDGVIRIYGDLCIYNKYGYSIM